MTMPGYLRPELWEKTYGYKYEETLYDPLLDKFVTKDEYLNFVSKEPGRQVIAYMPKRAEWLPYWLKTPGMTVASDGMPSATADGSLVPIDTDPSQYKGHPRVAGTYSTTLKLAREANVPLMFTLTQLSYTSAKHLGDTGLKAMQERGRVQVGKVADLTIFDPEKVAPGSTYKTGENGLPPTGIPYVVVGGKIALKDSVVQDVRAGQPIRFPVEDKGRFEAVTVNGWMGEHTINVPALPRQDTTDAPAALEQADEGAAAPERTGSTAPRSPQTSDLNMHANGTDDGKSTTGAVAGWFGDAVGPLVSDAAFCPIHGVLERHGDAAKGGIRIILRMRKVSRVHCCRCSRTWRLDAAPLCTVWTRNPTVSGRAKQIVHESMADAADLRGVVAVNGRGQLRGSSMMTRCTAAPGGRRADQAEL